MSYLRVSKNALHKAIVFGAGIVDRKAERAYANLYLKLQHGELTIEANGPVASSEIILSVENCENEFSFSVPATILDDQLKSIDSEIVSIIQTETCVIIKGDKVSIETPLTEATSTRAIESDTAFNLQGNIDLKEFGKKLKIVHRATFEGPADGITSNIYISDNEMRACDDCKFYCTQFPSTDGLSKGFQSIKLILPKKACAIIASFSEITPIAEFYESEDCYIFRGDRAKLIMMKSIAPYLMNYSKMRDIYNFDKKIEMKRDALLLAARRSLITSDRQNPEMKFRSNGNNLVVISEFKHHVTTQILGDVDREISLNINPKDLIEFLTPIDSADNIVVEFGSSIDPISVKIDDYKALIMPLRSENSGADEPLC